ncbi:hypothetical protein ABPG72_015766 [Tetrahymena utriculariae]
MELAILKVKDAELNATILRAIVNILLIFLVTFHIRKIKIVLSYSMKVFVIFAKKIIIQLNKVHAIHPIDIAKDFTCPEGYYYNFYPNITNILQMLLININPIISKYIEGPLYLIMLKYSLDFSKDKKYFNYSYRNQFEKCRIGCQKRDSKVIGCIQQINDFYIQCKNSGIYYILQQPSSENISIKYQSICGQSEDLHIKNCKLISNNQCVTCKEFL